MNVNRSPLRHRCIHVSDTDHHFDAAIGKTLREFNLIEVARSIVIDRRPQQTPQIAHIACRGDLGWMGLQFSQLLRNLRRKIRLKPALLHDLFCNGL